MDLLLEQIEDLKSISDKVKTYLDEEQYLSNYGQDSTTIEKILGDCYSLIIDELQEMGIVFWDTENSLLDDWWTAQAILHMRYVFDKNFFSNLLKNHYDLLPGIETVISSTEDPESNVSLILELLNNVFPDNKHIIVSFDHAHEIISNQMFNDHISAILNNLKKSPPLTIDDPSIVSEYILAIEKGRAEAKQAVSIIIENVTALALDIQLDKTQLVMWTNRYDLDKLNPNKVQTYALVDKEDIPVELKETATEYMDKHHRTVPHHIEYWLDKEGEIPYSGVIILVAHHYGADKPYATFKNDINHMLELGATVFSSHQLQFIDKCCGWLYPQIARIN